MSYAKNSTVPIELLPGIGTRTAGILKKMEIKTVGDFHQLPVAMLVEIFGPSIKKVYFNTNHGVRRTVPIGGRKFPLWVRPLGSAALKILFVFLLSGKKL